MASKNKYSQTLIDTNFLYKKHEKSFLSKYWFPIAVILVVIFFGIKTFYFADNTNSYQSKSEVALTKENKPLANKDKETIRAVKPRELKKAEPEKEIKTEQVVKAEQTFPKFEMVRIGDNGSLIITGNYKADTTISILANKINLGSEKTNKYGEFALTPRTKLKPGNYILTIMSENEGKAIYSSDNVFIYIAENATAKSSVSLLMTENGTKILQGPAIDSGNLILSKVDYLPNERILITGRSVPRLFVSLKLNDTEIGTTRVSDSGTFGLGKAIGTLNYETEYTLNAVLKDANGKIISETKQTFKFPKWEENKNVSFTVRKNDTLWLISRYHYGKGSMYSLIFNQNRDKIKNPDLIYPKQVFEIPMNY